VSSAAATKIPARLEFGAGRTILPLARTMSDLHYDLSYESNSEHWQRLIFRSDCCRLAGVFCSVFIGE